MMNPTEIDSPMEDAAAAISVPKESFGTKFKRFVTTLGIAAIAGGIGFGVGWWQGDVRLGEQKSSYDKTVAEVTDQLKRTQVGLKIEQSKSRMALARAALLQAAAELEQRNFGSANSQVQDAVQALAEVQESANGEQFNVVKEDVGTIEINFAINPEEQKKRILGLANKLTQLLP
jgi:hypothetical protein